MLADSQCFQTSGCLTSVQPPRPISTTTQAGNTEDPRILGDGAQMRSPA